MLWSLLLFIITISILVTVHEFGHFLIARLCGVRVERFSIGFGKKLWSHKFLSGTEFVIAMIPLGGYVRMLDGRAKPLLNNEEKFAFDRKKIWQRAAIVIAGPLANFLLAIIVYWVIFLMGVVTYPVKIERTLLDTPAASVNIPLGVELKTVNGISIDSWNDVNSALIIAMGENNILFSYFDNNESKEVTKNVDIKNWQFDIEKESAITAFGFVPKTLEIYPIVSRIIPNSAAEKAGLQVGDEIISYNDNPYLNWNDFTATIKKADAMTLIVKRGNQSVYLNLIPTINANGEGVAGLYPTSDAVIKQYGFIDGFGKGLE